LGFKSTNIRWSPMAWCSCRFL